MPIGTSNNVIVTRIQLKSDTEANWLLANNFIPKSGELIIYSTDASHETPRIKIGDGTTPVNDLPFIINGEFDIICKYNSYNSFPLVGSSKVLYLDTSTGQLYHYNNMTYEAIATVSVNATSNTIREVVSWGAGSAATAAIENNTLILTDGITPRLSTQLTSVLTKIEVGGNS